jgi:AraC family transcriptional regulator, ethanolamine operon transcriptional activator
VHLNGVRRELKSDARADRAVQDIAARWGFWHLGEFSADYKHQFGELPSATLRRGRGEGGR